MKLSVPFRREWIYGAALVLLAAVCGILALLQYRWIGEIARAENERLREDLQRNLNLVRHDFDAQLASSAAELVPTAKEIELEGRDKAYLKHYQRASELTKKYFTRVGLAVPEDGDVQLFLLNAESNEFRKEDWPLGWAKLREGLSTRLTGAPPEAGDQYRPEGVIEFPRFGGRPSRTRGLQGVREQEWLILEYDRNYLRSAILPAVLQRHLSHAGQPQYSVVVRETADAWREVYRWGPSSGVSGDHADAWITLFEINTGNFRGAGSRGAERRRQDESGPPDVEESPTPGHGVWTLQANHAAGSLEGIVARARRRNLFLAAGLLLLLIATVIALMRFTRGAEKLAQIQMNFVSGISHELRTPLSVLRAAGFNLRTKFSKDPSQVERYGALIQNESEKMTALVEQILRYGGAESGKILGTRELLEVAPLLEDSLPGTRQELQEAGIHIEEKIESNLPVIRADRQSLTHALRNLLENAVKHGKRERPMIRISADRAMLRGAAAIRIGILDNGPGIPKEDRQRVFEPFFRGQQAIENQVHGTGLGLNLAKRIVEAHGGVLSLRSELGKGAEFIAIIPAGKREVLPNDARESAG